MIDVMATHGLASEGAEAAEDVLDPELAVIDTHHHLWEIPGQPPYLHEAFVADLTSGHRVEATVHVQCFMGYEPTGPDELKPVGETAFVVRQAEAAEASGQTICQGIVGHADLDLGEPVGEVLDAHLEAGNGRFKGVRHLAMSDPDASTLYPEFTVPDDLYSTAAFRRGFAQLARRGLTFDAAVFHPQLEHVAGLAAAFPDTPIVVNHVGYPIGMGRFAGRAEEVRDVLRTAFGELARHPQVFVKFGGFGSKPLHTDFGVPRDRRTSESLAETFAPYFDLCIDTFGPARLMFESNFPVDSGVASYRTLWNAFKRLTLPFSPGERGQMLSANARSAYRL